MHVKQMAILSQKYELNFYTSYLPIKRYVANFFLANQSLQD